MHWNGEWGWGKCTGIENGVGKSVCTGIKNGAGEMDSVKANVKYFVYNLFSLPYKCTGMIYYLN